MKEIEQKDVFSTALKDTDFIEEMEETLQEQFFIPSVIFPTKDWGEDLEVLWFNCLYLWYLVWKWKYEEFINNLLPKE